MRSWQLEKFLFLISVCVYCAGRSSAETNRQNPVGGENEDYRQVSSHFFYQTPNYPRDCREVRNQCSSSMPSGVYLIKPDGYPEPFEVYCNNEIDSGGWTVIYRRLNGLLDFHRTWDDYKKGFGYLSSEFWLGNKQISFLTNQNVYEIRVDIILSNSTSFHIQYNSFRISDEWGKFALVAVGNYTGDTSSAVTLCPQNMIYGNCTCIATCQDPLGSSSCQTACEQSEACVCREGFLMDGSECVSPADCGCYRSEENRVVEDGETYVNVDCTAKCTCGGDQLNCDTIYQCSPDATCKVQDGVRQCYCNEGYEGDGEMCAFKYRDCNDVRDDGNTRDGVYPIRPSGWPGSHFNVFCNMTIDGGAWTVFQRRYRGGTQFYNNWERYKNGFGNIQRDFWLGNDKLYYITQQGTYELRVDVVSTPNARSSLEAMYAKYESFQIDSEANNYRVINIGSYSGNALNGMYDVEQQPFSTFDRDNDGFTYNCAKKHRGGWWFGGTDYSSAHHENCDRWVRGSTSTTCTKSHLNGYFSGESGQIMFWWGSYYDCYPKYTEMKIRRTS